MLPQHMAGTQRLNQSLFLTVSFPKMRSDLTEKYPVFSTVLNRRVHLDRTISFYCREAELCSHLSQHTCAHDCSHNSPLHAFHFPLPCSQRAACTTAQKDSFIFHILMPCHGNHGRQELGRKGKRQYVQLLPD